MANPTIKPTVGRIVWFHPDPRTGESGFACHNDDGPYAAIIVRVWSDFLVNLSVFDANGVAHSRTSVALVQEGDPVPDSCSYCEWLPYQKGQAARAQRDDLERVMVDPDTQRAPMPGDPCIMVNMNNPSGDIPSKIAAARSSARSALALARSALIDAQATATKLLNLPVIAGPDALEREIAAQATAPRVTPADIEAEIKAEYIFTLDKALADFPVAEGLDRVTVAVVVLRNGTKLVGVNYGAIDPANHSPDMGRKEARAQAIEQAWPLLGFRLRDKLAGTAACLKPLPNRTLFW